MCFGDAALRARKLEPTFAAHFDPSAGPCFSFLLTDIGAGTLLEHTNLKINTQSWVWEADSVTFTMIDAPLVGGSILPPPAPKVTVQVSLALS